MAAVMDEREPADTLLDHDRELVGLDAPIVAGAGVPNGIRTRVVAVKGRCPRPLDDGDFVPLTLVTRVGIEPTTNWLKASCSTTELRALATAGGSPTYGSHPPLSTAATGEPETAARYSRERSRSLATGYCLTSPLLPSTLNRPRFEEWQESTASNK